MDNTNTIPKYIHYCWFGGKEIPQKYMHYINTWKKYFPDYELIRWDESNFPIEEYVFAKEAYDVGKWAFVSDVARIYALYKLGGIYFDTDVEVLRPFDKILKSETAILGTEAPGKTIGTGFMAFPKEHEICDKLLKYYSEHSFLAQPKEQSNTELLADLIKTEYNISPSTEIQKGKGFILYPMEFFTAYNGSTGKKMITENTYCIHHFAASWFSTMRRIKRAIKKVIYRLSA